MEDAEKPWLYPELPQISFSDLKKKKTKKKTSVFSNVLKKTVIK